MNLPDAIERMRELRQHLLNEMEFWGEFDADHPEMANDVVETRTKDAAALAVCLEVLAEHAHDGGALLREVNPKAYSTLESAPPLTPEERTGLQVYECPCHNARAFGEALKTMPCGQCHRACTVIREGHFASPLRKQE